MKKLFLLLLLAPIMLTSCEKKAKVEGTFNTSEFDGKFVYLQMNEDLFKQDMITLDSAKVKDGKFELTTKAPVQPELALVSLNNLNKGETPVEGHQTITNIILEEGTVNLSFEKEKIDIKGTPLNDEYANILKETAKAQDFYKSTMQKIEAEDIGEEGQKELAKELNDKLADLEKLSTAFMKANMKNSVGQALFITAIQGLSEAEIVEMLALTTEEFRNKDQIKVIQNMLDENAKRLEKFMNKQFLDAKLTPIKGKEVSISDYAGKGKYVLVDFWASWCGPCINEMPALKEAYAKYKGDKFEILAISVDQDEASWKEAIKKLDLSWPQTRDAKGDAAVEYGVNAIPFTLLIDPNGKVIESNLRGEQLEQKLQELIK